VVLFYLDTRLALASLIAIPVFWITAHANLAAGQKGLVATR
jgi:hypothetical protein